MLLLHLRTGGANPKEDAWFERNGSMIGIKNIVVLGMEHLNTDTKPDLVFMYLLSMSSPYELHHVETRGVLVL